MMRQMLNPNSPPTILERIQSGRRTARHDDSANRFDSFRSGRRTKTGNVLGATVYKTVVDSAPAWEAGAKPPKRGTPALQARLHPTEVVESASLHSANPLLVELLIGLQKIGVLCPSLDKHSENGLDSSTAGRTISAFFRQSADAAANNNLREKIMRPLLVSLKMYSPARYFMRSATRPGASCLNPARQS